MSASTALQPLPYTHADYEQFETIYNGFCYIFDHKNDPLISIYTYKQTEVHENLVEFWPTITVMCQSLKIPQTVTLQDIDCIFSGFDAESIAALYKNERYAGIPRKKIVPMEEYRLFQIAKSLFDTLMVRLQRLFQKLPKTPACLPKTPPADPDGDDYITFAEAAKMLSVHKSTVSRWVDQGKIRDNGRKGQGRKLLCSDVLLVRHKLEAAELLDDASDLRAEARLVPNRH